MIHSGVTYEEDVNRWVPAICKAVKHETSLRKNYIPVNTDPLVALQDALLATPTKTMGMIWSSLDSLGPAPRERADSTYRPRVRANRFREAETPR